ncbi:DUF2087 domain-containing protein [Rhodomicrobium vannielii ATCC 17100]|uniref:DUF2087 domain-containing protein n=1 Tax=Rhodomicrobium vannielii TaxID=1069 RepID=UPI001918ED0D|nr:DUF2087 domain-containing protein [Rhodomicrobium vannielii]MBJ7534154.1 DUF2087 domain-containing protein [Rhodomicrobium vannielii ATCC 17100]
MSKTVFPYAATDISALARSLGRELETTPEKPGHVQLLNMLARGAGFRNFQHFRAQQEAEAKLERTPPAPEPVDFVRVERLARYFDAAGRFIRWPSKASHRDLCLWVMWSRWPAGLVLHEREVNDLLNANHLFGDHALLRREMVDTGLVTRTPDCREYRRVEKKPPADAVALIRHVGRACQVQ